MPEPEATKPETLRLFRKNHSAWVITLAILDVLGAIAFAIYIIYSAPLPPDLP